MTLKKCKYKLFLSKEWIRRINISFKSWARDILNCIYPSYCWICNKNLPDNQLLCVHCELSLPWTSFTPIVEDAIGVYVEKIFVQKCIVLFWVQEPHFMQQIIASLEQAKHAIWIDFFEQQILKIFQQISFHADYCIQIPINKKRLLNPINAFDTILDAFKKQFHIPSIKPFVKKNILWSTSTSTFKLKDKLILANQSIILFTDSLCNPHIETAVRLLQKANVKHITLICLINRI